jgi:RNA polymerase sigma-70 factor, ECF subfamily
MFLSPTDTRASLIQRLRDEADLAAWDEVTAVYGPLILRMATRQGLQLADAEDVAQEVFSVVVRSIDQWLDQPSRGRFRGWLFGICRNTALNLLNRAPHGGIGGAGVDGLESLAEPYSTDDESSREFDLEYQREVYRWAANQVRSKVAETTWQAFERTHLEGCSIAEVAQKLGLSVANVYIARSRVMSHLRKLVKKYNEVSDE